MLSLVMIPAILVTSPTHAKFAYAAFGFSQMLMFVGNDTVLMELSPERGQAGYLSAMALASMLAILFFSGVSYFSWPPYGGFTTLAILTGRFCFVGFLLSSRIGPNFLKNH